METVQDTNLQAMLQNNAHTHLNSADGHNSVVQHVSFAIDNELYGVDIMAVREIKAWTEVTRLPRQAEFVRGVLNLRGVVVPIFDLRCRFGAGMTDATPTHVVIIVQIQGKLVGLLVDRVSDILTIQEAEIQPVPDTVGASEDELFSGIVAVGGEMIALLDLEKVDTKILDSGAEASENSGPE